ncbi:DUF4041 domain-containing protein [Paraclostridium bifermentans]|uniref:DUF4041 domain-containing protein n=1 Tax=Paraclostridium TaxID=1849822 RepID=UPI0004169D3F|nr:DUF4041 domain-containing protein [Paraclostridium bifermentans]
MFDFFKGKKYKKEVEELKSKLKDIRLTEEQTKYLDVKKELENLEQKKIKTSSEVSSLEKQIYELKSTLVNLKDEQELQSYGFYEPKYGLESSQVYKIRLDNIRGEQKGLVRQRIATNHSTDYLVEGDKKKGKEFILDTVKLSLRAFNNECDNIISKVKFTNVEKSVERINKIYKEINSLTDMQKVSITNEYLKLKIEELYLKYEYECKKQEEKEEQQAIKERMKEEARVLKEIEAEKKKIEKEEIHFKNAINDLNTKIESATDEEKDKLIQKLIELENKLNEVKLSKEDVMNREKNTRAGYVYIISNIGSFGEDVYKIGMTRRLDPNDRVRELGSASVPFNFDIHAMIFSDDAPTLENKLHKRFVDNQVNKVNPRKEFFKVSLNEIEEVVKTEFDKPVEFTKLAEAEEYRKSLGNLCYS